MQMLSCWTRLNKPPHPVIYAYCRSFANCLYSRKLRFVARSYLPFELCRFPAQKKGLKKAKMSQWLPLHWQPCWGLFAEPWLCWGLSRGFPRPRAARSIPGARHCRQRGVSRTHSLLFPLNLHLSFLVPDLILFLRLLVVGQESCFGAESFEPNRCSLGHGHLL